MTYLLSEHPSEDERLRLQSLVWEPAGRRLLDEIGARTTREPRRALDVGCGVLGWLRLLSDWAGPHGAVTGTDIAPRMVELAAAFAAHQQLVNVTVVQDDLFASTLPEHAFDLVHARFQLAPLGRVDEQLAAYLRLVAPGGLLVLEEPDSASWRSTPDAPRTDALIALIRAGFREAGGDFDAGRHTFSQLRAAGLDPQLRAEVVALHPGHPYLLLPVQFAGSLRGKLERLLPADQLGELVAASTEELRDPDRTGLTFTLVQTWCVVRGVS